MASSTVKVHPERLQNVISSIASDNGLGTFMATEALRGMVPYVPYRDGTLSDSGAVVAPFHVRYSTPYADRVYEGRRMTIHTDRHPKATTQWDKKWFAEHKADYCKSILGYIEGMV